MAEQLSKGASRNIYYGGSLFFFLVLIGLTFDTVVRELPNRDNHEQITSAVAKGKNTWEVNNCVGCHTLLGEGAYFAPELANVYQRRGGSDEAAFKAYMQGWMAAQPIAIEGRRKMPQFNLTEEEVNDLSDFLIYVSGINSNDWPPNIEG